MKTMWQFSSPGKIKHRSLDEDRLRKEEINHIVKIWCRKQKPNALEPRAHVEHIIYLEQNLGSPIPCMFIFLLRRQLKPTAKKLSSNTVFLTIPAGAMDVDIDSFARKLLPVCCDVPRIQLVSGREL